MVGNGRVAEPVFWPVRWLATEDKAEDLIDSGTPLGCSKLREDSTDETADSGRPVGKDVRVGSTGSWLVIRLCTEDNFDLEGREEISERPNVGVG